VKTAQPIKSWSWVNTDVEKLLKKLLLSKQELGEKVTNSGRYAKIMERNFKTLDRLRMVGNSPCGSLIVCAGGWEFNK